MEIKTLDGVNIAEIAETFNAAFSDYLVPIQLSENDLRAKMQSENTVPAYSAGAFTDGKLIGFILIGIDGQIAYNGGTGVIPAFRGQNLTTKMYSFLLPLLAQKGITTHRLEVITENIKAIPVYEKIGFKIIRTVICFKGSVSGNTDRQKLEEIELTAIRDNFFDFEPTYQNTAAAILRARSQHTAIGAFADDQLVGFIVFSPSAARVKQFAVARDFRNKGLGKRLFQEVQKIVGDRQISLINVDDRDGSIDFLQKIGLEKTVRQFEMELRHGR
jgi:ribosomal protein S18 acetylase RimI-like enzyme